MQFCLPVVQLLLFFANKKCQQVNLTTKKKIHSLSWMSMVDLFLHGFLDFLNFIGKVNFSNCIEASKGSSQRKN